MADEELPMTRWRRRRGEILAYHGLTNDERWRRATILLFQCGEQDWHAAVADLAAARLDADREDAIRAVDACMLQTLLGDQLVELRAEYDRCHDALKAAWKPLTDAGWRPVGTFTLKKQS